MADFVRAVDSQASALDSEASALGSEAIENENSPAQRMGPESFMIKRLASTSNRNRSRVG